MRPVGPASPRLVVNADDLGYDPEIDRGILEACRRGVVTSATVMVDTPFAASAIAAAPGSLGLGVHVVLDPAAAPADVAGEVRRQVERFRALAGRDPTHLDSHKHLHARAEVLDAFAGAAAALGLPVRAIDAAGRERLRALGVATTDAFLGDASLRPCWTPEQLAEAILGLEAATAEVMCHPGFSPSVARTSFASEREVELAAVCDPRVSDAVRRRGVALIRWDALRLPR